jgi:tRNA (guanine-N7-)-methyltransferase
MATDWQHYAEQMLNLVDIAEGYKNCAGVGNYSHRPAYRPLTKFEKRGKKLGHGILDLIAEKTC